MLAWKVAGYFGLDFFALPLLGVPSAKGKLFGRAKAPAEAPTQKPVTA